MLRVSNIMARVKCPESDGEETGENCNLEELTNQCQRYEEQIVELHSVIAELSRKLEVERDDIIPEETETSCDEFDEVNNESFEFEDDLERKVYSPTNQTNINKNRKVLNKEQQDYNSLVFERDLDSQLTDSNCIIDIDKGQQVDGNPILRAPNCDNEIDKSYRKDNVDKNELGENKNVLYKIELFDQVQQELLESRQELDQLRELLTIKDGEKDAITSDRNSLKRQLDDLQATMEYQEAKMDLKKKPSNICGSRKTSTTSARSNNDIPVVSSLTIDDTI